MTGTVRAPQMSETQELFVRPEATVREPRRCWETTKRRSGAKDATEQLSIHWSDQKSIDSPFSRTKKVDAANMSETVCST
uniref:OSJNBa0083D01.18 protein n=1 Tax=Oryza sativa subsp. japonica TaxID=39947 RepID=Q7XVE4_ORYSJ|nr:OSJNBa0083D01.18 [Oryza sativa Japonica Group]